VILGKYSFGIGDRFGRQGKALLAAMEKAKQQGVDFTPVWNKSYREHSIIGTKPADVRKEADEAVTALGWQGPYFVDADHINLSTVDAFVDSSDFFTLDVAEFIAKRADRAEVDFFVQRHNRFIGSLEIEGIDEPLQITQAQVEAAASKYILAVKHASKVYRHIEAAKGAANFVVEVSMDETAQPQTPVELLFILAAIAHEGIPAQTIAPRFTGRFNKGVDYVGDVTKFEKEFQQDVAVIKFAVKEFGLPENLKLSVHSGSDKFSLYAPINQVLKKFDAGLHIKTAGTTWLEELTSLAAAGGDGLAISKAIYAQAFSRMDELCGPYATVIDIDIEQLPSPEQVDNWDGKAFVAALHHDQSCDDYNPNFRQLLHVAYKIAAEMSSRFLDALEEYQRSIAPNVTTNIYERHIKPLFMLVNAE
jgi:hypothetical protein